jgi:putative transposase
MWMLPSRKSVRLRNHDYSTGTYFITICSAQRLQIFGTIVNAELVASPLGFKLRELWARLPAFFCNVSLGPSKVMPNHFHGVVRLRKLLKGEAGCSSLQTLAGSFKSAVTREAHQLNLHEGPVFQPGFYDHAIRHEGAYQRVSEYIENNPRQWELDKENPNRTGDNDFYNWVEAYTRRVRDETK